MAGTFGASHNLIFFPAPAANRREDERERLELGRVEDGEDPIVKNIGFDKLAMGGELLAFGLFPLADDGARGKELSPEGLSEFSPDRILAGHGETEEIDRADAEPRFEGGEFERKR